MPFPVLIAAAIVVIYLLNCIKVLKEYERAVVFRLGRVRHDAAGPGVIFVFGPMDRFTRVSLRQEAMEVPSQDIITRDNVTLKVNAVITLRVVDPVKAVIEVSNYVYQTSQFAQTTLRSVLGEVDLDELLAHRDRLNQRIQTIIDGHTSPFGVKVVSVEVKQVDMPETMLRAMAKQAEAERERRAKIIHAEGEFNAAAKLVQGGGADGDAADDAAAAVSADADGDWRGEEYDHCVSAADGADESAEPDVSAGGYAGCACGS